MIYAALKPFAHDLHPTVHLFSTTLVDIPVRDLLNGMRITDGGTRIRAVTDHIIASHVRKALLVTDGLTGFVDKRDLSLLKSRGFRITVLLTASGRRSDLEPLASRFYELNKLEEMTWGTRD